MKKKQTIGNFKNLTLEMRSMEFDVPNAHYGEENFNVNQRAGAFPVK